MKNKLKLRYRRQGVPQRFSLRRGVLTAQILLWGVAAALVENQEAIPERWRTNLLLIAGLVLALTPSPFARLPRTEKPQS